MSGGQGPSETSPSEGDVAGRLSDLESSLDRLEETMPTVALALRGLLGSVESLRDVNVRIREMGE